MKRVLLGAALALALVFGLAGSGSAQVTARAGESCLGFTGALCGKGQFCDQATCRALIGTCEKIPDVCLASGPGQRNYAPVCGCNGKTYGNDCERKRAQVSRAYNGPCLFDRWKKT